MVYFLWLCLFFLRYVSIGSKYQMIVFYWLSNYKVTTLYTITYLKILAKVDYISIYLKKTGNIFSFSIFKNHFSMLLLAYIVSKSMYLDCPLKVDSFRHLNCPIWSIWSNIREIYMKILEIFSKITNFLFQLFAV